MWLRDRTDLDVVWSRSENNWHFRLILDRCPWCQGTHMDQLTSILCSHLNQAWLLADVGAMIDDSCSSYRRLLLDELLVSVTFVFVQEFETVSASQLFPFLNGHWLFGKAPKHAHDLQYLHNTGLLAQIFVGLHHMVLLAFGPKTSTLPFRRNEVLPIGQHWLRTAPLHVILGLYSYAIISTLRLWSIFDFLEILYEIILVGVYK